MGIWAVKRKMRSQWTNWNEVTNYRLVTAATRPLAPQGKQLEIMTFFNQWLKESLIVYSVEVDFLHVNLYLLLGLYIHFTSTIVILFLEPVKGANL